MRSSFVAIGVGFLLSISMVSSNAAVIPVSSALIVDTKAGHGVAQVVDTGSASQGVSLSALGASALAQSNSAAGTQITSGQAQASWINSAAGQVRFDDFGWDNSGFSKQVVGFNSLAGTQWTYTFIADVTGAFSLDWNVSLDQDLIDSFGLSDIRFSLIGAAGSQSVMQVNTTGFTTRNIYAGSQYTALIETNAGLFGGVGGRTSYMDGVFNWSMDSGPDVNVPAPASLLVFALGLLGFNLRRIV